MNITALEFYNRRVKTPNQPARGYAGRPVAYRKSLPIET